MQKARIIIVNRSTVTTDAELPRLRDALEDYVDDFLAPAWGVGAELLIGKQSDVKPTDWELLLTDTPDVADAFGYHDVTKSGYPLMKVFCKTCLDEGEPISLTASHEVAEALVNPGCVWGAEGPASTWYATEVCDPVQGNSFPIGAVLVSDFVHPEWFEKFRKPNSVQFSHLGTVKKPFKLDKGGWIPVYRAGRWRNLFGSRRARSNYMRRAHHRTPMILSERQRVSKV